MTSTAVPSTLEQGVNPSLDVYFVSRVGMTAGDVLHLPGSSSRSCRKLEFTKDVFPSAHIFLTLCLDLKKSRAVLSFHDIGFQ
jgi:hypothetical protein